MQIKKTAIAMMMFLVATFAFADFASAQGYSPLVQIPGVSLINGTTNLSLYLVGMYNFLLSIVGIVAVMMLIIGGMKYITAAGNQAAVSDAKDTIYNALFGLLLAILSWVIVAEINPDVLYIKSPSSEFASSDPVNLGLSCGVYDAVANTCVCDDGISIAGTTSAQDCANQCDAGGHCLLCVGSYDPVGDALGAVCTCRDGTVLVPTFASAAICDLNCSVSNCDFSNLSPCTKAGTPVDSSSPNFEGKCNCINDDDITLPAGQTCQEACKIADCLVADLRIGHYQPIIAIPVEDYCIYSSPKENPLVMTDNMQVRPCVHKTISGNRNAGWEHNFAGSGWIADPPSNSPTWSVFAGYAALLLEPSCEQADDGGGFVLCPFAVRAYDTVGNMSEDVLWVKVLEPIGP